MEKIEITIRAEAPSGISLRDERVLVVEATRGDVAKKLDEFVIALRKSFGAEDKTDK